MNEALGDVLAFWGKTSSRQHGQPSLDPGIHKPVLHHLFDVGAVALRLQLLNRARLEREAVLLAMSPEAYARLSAFLAALHDLGKFAMAFQAKRRDLWPQGVLGEFRPPIAYSHWRGTAILLRATRISDAFDAFFPDVTDSLSPIVAAIAGHHGVPPDSESHDSKVTPLVMANMIGPASVNAAHRAFGLLAEHIAPSTVSVSLTEDGIHRWSWRLSGLITLADWVGSDQAFFDFEPVDMPLDAYWRKALEQADKALHAKGLIAQEIHPSPDLARLAPAVATRPRPMQEKAARAALSPGPQLFIMEDTTGSGKTEAALLLAARMMAAGKGEGIYFALPTMATANGIYDRLAEAQSGSAAAYRKLFQDAAEPSLVLSHGKAHLSRALKTIDDATCSGQGEDEGEKDVAAFCAEWIADNRRKAFFADVGAGTIDQAFLAILRKKHLTLRQYGLGGRVLIVDEAHSFDAYMGKELATLMELQAAQGGSAIILSATLSMSQKKQIAEAFAGGLGVDGESGFSDAMTSQAYPLLTSVSRDRIKEDETELDPALRRSVAVERLDNRDLGIAQALEAASNGAAVLIICNAVDEAVGVHQRLLGQITDADRLHLFHARYAHGDRQAIETDIVGRFGRRSERSEREGRILVATQVVEQSLDLDFDLIVTDLAPIDLLIQRAGRLWRHMDERPPRDRLAGGPRLLVVSADPVHVTDEKWLEPALGKAAFVYRHAGVMWRSAKLLFEARAVHTPESFRPMIEEVYGSGEAPSVLNARIMSGEGEGSAGRTMASLNTIKLAEGYGSLSSTLSADERIGTRLADETVTLRLARLEDGHLKPWAAARAADEKVAWALSEVTVRKTWLGRATPSREDLAMSNRAKATWPEWERSIDIFVVEDDGRVKLENGESGTGLTYDGRGGLLSGTRL